jgi:hypothetical protein
VVPAAKAQSARVRSTFFQRRAGLATLLVDVAGGGAVPRVTDEAVATAERLLAGWRAGASPRRPHRMRACTVDSLAPVGYIWCGLFVLRCEVAQAFGRSARSAPSG